MTVRPDTFLCAINKKLFFGFLEVGKMSLVRAVGAGRKPDTGNSVAVVNGSECLQKVEIPMGLRDENATQTGTR